MIAERYGVNVTQCCPYYKGRLKYHLSDMQLFMAFLRMSQLNPIYEAPLATVERVDCRRVLEKCNVAPPMLHFQGHCKRKMSEFAKMCAASEI